MPAANSLASNKIMQIQRVKWSDVEYLSVQFLIQTSFNIQFKQFPKFNSFALYILNFNIAFSSFNRICKLASTGNL